MKPKTLTYYDYYEDIRPELCKLLKIEEKYFRKYHEIVGGKYKDFWHVWLNFVDENVRNDSFSRVWWEPESWKKSEYLKKEVSKQYGDWCYPLFEAMDELMKNLKDEKIIIWYCW